MADGMFKPGERGKGRRRKRGTSQNDADRAGGSQVFDGSPQATRASRIRGGKGREQIIGIYCRWNGVEGKVVLVRSGGGIELPTYTIKFLGGGLTELGMGGKRR